MWLAGAGWGDALLFAPAAWPTEGGTYFAFLADLWRRYPSHWVVLVIARPVVLGAHGDGYSSSMKRRTKCSHPDAG